MTVETAVAIAGGFRPRGYHKTMIISRNFAGGTLSLRRADHLPDLPRRHRAGSGTLVLNRRPVIGTNNPMADGGFPFYFTFLARNAIERSQASLAAASL